MPTKSELLAENRAIYLPAIPDTFARFAHNGAFSRPLPIAASELNFLDPTNSVFFYPFALYSAGQAAPLNGGSPPPSMVTQRDRSATILLGDSGGFQIQTDKIKFHRQETAPQIMRWLEQVADWSMVLDFPTGGIGRGAMRKHVADLRSEGFDLDGLSRASGLSVDYTACLVQTKINNDRFVAERTPGKTRFLNVLQGRNEAESRHWLHEVKHYPFEGWAFAGAHRDHFSLIVRRLLDMRDEGILQRCDWLHVLGISTLTVGCLLTTIQRAVREFVNPRFQISFDSASPFRTAGNKSIMVGSTLDEYGWSVQHHPVSQFGASDDQRLLSDVLGDRLAGMADAPPRRRQLAESFLVNKLRLGDLRDGNGDVSSDGYWLLMHHNIEATINAHRDAHGLFFEEIPLIYDPAIIPSRLQTISTMIRMAFSGEVIKGKPIDDPYARIAEWEPWLDALA
jgi:hypothetical protein